MKSERTARWRRGESGQAFTVIARLETGGGHPALSGLKFLRIVSREEGTDPALNRAARNPGGDPV
jgi:hypothetical protein